MALIQPQMHDEIGPYPHHPMIPPMNPPMQEPTEIAGPQPHIHLALDPVWTYKIVVYSQQEAAALTAIELNQLGEDGWELAGILPVHQSVHFYFKRLQE